MPVLKRRSRIVSFRLSDEEYAAMMESCISQGSRSLSDYARSAACHHPDGGNGFGGDGEKGQSILELRNRVEELDRMVHLLTRAMGPSQAAGGGSREMAAHPSQAPPRSTRRKGNGDLP